MDEFAENYFLFSDYVRAHAATCTLVCAIALPFIYFTRRHSGPIILSTVEISIYVVTMHVVFYLVVPVAAWFRTNSSVYALTKEGVPIDAVFWSTPLVRFWDKDLYDPQWIMYVECGFMVAIILAILKFRPVRIPRAKPRSTINANRRDLAIRDAQALARKYGAKRYADEWARKPAKSPRKGFFS